MKVGVSLVVHFVERGQVRVDECQDNGTGRRDLWSRFRFKDESERGTSFVALTKRRGIFFRTQEFDVRGYELTMSPIIPAPTEVAWIWLKDPLRLRLTMMSKSIPTSCLDAS